MCIILYAWVTKDELSTRTPEHEYLPPILYAAFIFPPSLTCCHPPNFIYHWKKAFQLSPSILWTAVGKCLRDTQATTSRTRQAAMWIVLLATSAQHSMWFGHSSLGILKSNKGIMLKWLLVVQKWWWCTSGYHPEGALRPLTVGLTRGLRAPNPGIS